MQQHSRPLRIGALADAAGVGAETIRYYERRQLLGRPARPYGGQRAYPPEYVQRVRFIKRAQAIGFTLDEIAELLALERGTGHARARALATRRLAMIEDRLAGLAAMRDALRHVVHECEHAHGRVACPIIDTLAREAPTQQPAGVAERRRTARR
jgi:MerR family mercuric resistance operon transcriptional regulator